MLLDRDEFLIAYDPAKADAKLLLETVKETGYTARVISSNNKSITEIQMTLPRGFPLLDDALEKAKAENKPIVLDFNAEWCAPCRRLEQLTFPDPKVKALLEQTVFIRIDTDKYPDIAQRLGVEGLPDIRFASPEGKIIRQLRSFQDAESFAVELERLLQKVMRK